MPDSEQVVTEVYRGQKAVSIDHGVMEKASQIAVIPVEMGWNDLGRIRSPLDMLSLTHEEAGEE